MNRNFAHLTDHHAAGEFLRRLPHSDNAIRWDYYSVPDHNQFAVFLDAVVDANTASTSVLHPVCRGEYIHDPVGIEFFVHFHSPAAAQPEVQSSKISTQLESEFDSASQSSYLSSPESARDQYGTDRKNKNDCTKNIVFRGQDGSP